MYDYIKVLLLVILLVTGGTISFESDIVLAETADTEEESEYIDVETPRDIDIAFDVTSKWDHHYNAQVTIYNGTSQKIPDWEICLPLADKIEKVWNAELVSDEDGRYVIRNVGWNRDILYEKSVSFGMTVRHEDNF